MNVILSEKGEVIVKKSNLDYNSQSFYPRADIVVCQLASKVESQESRIDLLSKEVLKSEYNKEFNQIHDNKSNYQSNKSLLKYSNYIGSNLNKYNYTSSTSLYNNEFNNNNTLIKNNDKFFSLHNHVCEAGQNKNDKFEKCDKNDSKKSSLDKLNEELTKNIKSKDP